MSTKDMKPTSIIIVTYTIILRIIIFIMICQIHNAMKKKCP